MVTENGKISIIYHTEGYTDNNENNKKAAVFTAAFFNDIETARWVKSLIWL